MDAVYGGEENDDDARSRDCVLLALPFEQSSTYFYFRGGVRSRYQTAPRGIIKGLCWTARNRKYLNPFIGEIFMSDNDCGFLD